MRCSFCLNFLVLKTILILPFSSSSDHIISKEVLNQLDDWEINVLRDFLHGRGRPIVHRVPLDNLGESSEFEMFPTSKKAEYKIETFTKPNKSEVIDLMSPTMMSQGGMMKSENERQESRAAFSIPFPMTPPQPITQFITPNHRRKTAKVINQEKPLKNLESVTSTGPALNEPSVEDYEQLTNVIQMFIDRRSNEKKRGNLRAKPISSIEPENFQKEINNPPLPDQIITSSKNDRLVSFDTNTRSKTNKWSPMERFTPQLISSNIATEERHQHKFRENYEKKMKELSGELTKILKQLEESKSERQPQVIVLRNGSAEQTPNRQYVFIATITLIKDGDRNILVDTGLGTNINARTDLLKALENHGLNPASIDVVVSTHGHPDHTGGLHDFPDAIHYHSWYSHYKTEFNLTELFENDSMNLSENVMLVKAKGHTSDDIAVIVRDAKHRGDVLVSGDLFMRGEDVDHPMMWQPLSADIIAQRDSRRRYGCIVGWIVPGHGPMFKVTNDIKKSLKC